ncbi:MAG TPA: type III secretion system chaperone [Chlamydiales bacterium]|nr:type III secretion system chaperone [Chlamydiales bacterium]
MEDFLKTLCDELKMPVPIRNKEKVFVFPFSDTISVQCIDLEPGVAFLSTIHDCPKKKREDLFIWIMQANLLGQGTGGCRIGLDKEEKVLTLSFAIPYEIDYRLFRERFEDFVNYVTYWREEIEKFEKQEVL